MAVDSEARAGGTVGVVCQGLQGTEDIREARFPRIAGEVSLDSMRWYIMTVKQGSGT